MSDATRQFLELVRQAFFRQPERRSNPVTCWCHKCGRQTPHVIVFGEQTDTTLCLGCGSSVRTKACKELRNER